MKRYTSPYFALFPTLLVYIKSLPYVSAPHPKWVGYNMLLAWVTLRIDKKLFLSFTFRLPRYDELVHVWVYGSRIFTTTLYPMIQSHYSWHIDEQHVKTSTWLNGLILRYSILKVTFCTWNFLESCYLCWIMYS